MESPTPQTPPAAANDRLVTTLFLAGLFHGIIILGVSFDTAGGVDPDALPTLEVLLVNEDLPEARNNSEADYLAQRNQQGSGNARNPQRTSSPSSAPTSVDNFGAINGQALQERQTGRQHSEPDVLAGLAAAARNVRLGELTDANEGAPQTAILLRAGPVSPLPSNDEGEQLVLKGKHDDELLITPNTRGSDVAVYLDGWRRKVERVGTLHFPLQARRRALSGSPVLEVAIRADGALDETIVRRSSGHAELDQAALAILKLAAPFDPFPTELRERHRTMRFAYEWQFLAGELVDSSLQAPVSP